MNIFASKTWARRAPMKLSSETDTYYSRLAGRISSVLMPMAGRIPIEGIYDILDDIACKSSSYLEDIVSGFGVFDAFRSLCRKRFGRTLPFYDTRSSVDGYYPDEVNVEDLKFIVWQTFSRHRIGYFYYPDSELVNYIASSVAEILVDAWEKAPENRRVARQIDDVIKKGSSIKDLRELMGWLCEGCYLTSIDGLDEYIMENAIDIAFKKGISSKETEIVRYSLFYSSVMDLNLPPLGLKSNIYLAEMARLRGYEEIASDLDCLQYIEMSGYKILEVANGTAVLECIMNTNPRDYAVGKLFNVELQSFSDKRSLRDCYYLTTGLIGLGGKWYCNGMVVFYDDKPKGNVEEAYTANLHELKAEIEKTGRELMERNGGRRMAFFKTREDAMKWIWGEDGAKIPEEMMVRNDFGAADNFTVYIAEDGMYALIGDIARYLEADNNPFFDKEKACHTIDGSSMILVKSMPYEAKVYAAKEGMLREASIGTSKGEEAGHAIVQDNLLFWIDFYNSTESYWDYLDFADDCHDDYDDEDDEDDED